MKNLKLRLKKQLFVTILKVLRASKRLERKKKKKLQREKKEKKANDTITNNRSNSINTSGKKKKKYLWNLKKIRYYNYDKNDYLATSYSKFLKNLY